MELRICCDAVIAVNKEFEIGKCESSINDYEYNDSNLTGNVLVSGYYKLLDDGIEYEFNELVPFTLVFKSENYSIDEIKTENFSYYEVVNHGIECNFEIVVSYEVLENPIILEDNIEVRESEEVLKEKNEEPSLPEDEEEIVSEFKLKEEFEEDENDENADPDDIARDINLKYDNLLKNVFMEQNREQNDNINLKVKEEKEGVDFSSFKETRSTVSVYFTKKESEIEKICSLENVSVKSIYENDANKDFADKRRIVINK